MCCNVRGLLIGAFPNAPKRRNARGVKKLKPLAERFPKALIRSIFLFVVIVKLAKMCQKAAFGLHLTEEATRRPGVSR
jgi:DNA-binding sugar fermentation-stimulating protein